MLSSGSKSPCLLEENIDSEATLSLLAYGEYLRASTRFEESLKIFQEALQVASNIRPVNKNLLVSANMDLGNVELTLGNYAASEGFYRAVVDLNPAPDPLGFALYRVATTCSYQGKIDSALAVFRKSAIVADKANHRDLLRLQIWSSSVTALWLKGRSGEPVIPWKISDGKKTEFSVFEERTNALGRFFVPDYRPVLVPGASACRKIVNAMRSKLGAADPYYVASAKEFSILLEICGYLREAEDMGKLAESGRRHVAFTDGSGAVHAISDE